MKITNIDRATTRKIAKEAEKALKAVMEKHGVAVSYKGGNYDGSNCVLKFQFTADGADTREAKDFRLHCRRFGLKPEHLEQIFNSRGRDYTVKGIKPRATKRPVLCERDDGQLFSFPANVVVSKLS